MRRVPTFLCLSAGVLLLPQYFALPVPPTFLLSISLVMGGHLDGSWGEHRSTRHASTGARVAREAGESLSKSTVPALSWIWGSVRSGSSVVPLFGVMLKLDMEGMAAGIWRVALRFARGFLNFFSILAVPQACYPFGQEVALEHAVEPGTACSSQATGRENLGASPIGDGRQMELPRSFQTGCCVSSVTQMQPGRIP